MLAFVHRGEAVWDVLALRQWILLAPGPRMVPGEARISPAILMLMAALALFSACSGPQGSPGPGGKVRVAVSIPPLVDFVRQIGGARVEVELLVPPGASVEVYEPTPRQVQFVAQAQLLVLNGLGLEFWAEKVVKGSGNPSLVVLDTSKGVPALEGYGSGLDPHVWLDPSLAMIQVEQIRGALSRLDPAGAEDYRLRTSQYLGTLESLDQELAERIKNWRYRKFIAFHSAWRYFAARYGLEQVAVIEEFPGKEPSPQYLADVARKAKSLEAKAIFAEPQLSQRAAQAIAAEAGKEVLILDDLGGVPGRATYIDLMRYNIDQMEKALGGP